LLLSAAEPLGEPVLVCQASAATDPSSISRDSTAFRVRPALGLNDSRAQNHEEIGEWLGVGQERSRQIEREALHRLRSIPVTSWCAA
jgi:hypothetical protein